MHTRGGTLDFQAAELIRARYAAGGVSQAALGAEFGVTQVMISLIIRRKTWVSETVACKICGTEFKPTGTQSAYCKDECFVEGRKIRTMRIYRARNPFADLHCPHCGDAFTQTRLNQHFCAVRCEQGAHNELRKAKWKVRDAAGVVVEEVSRAYIIKRDRARCHLCGRKCRADEIHLDHVVPLARGGDHSAANVRVACARCNLSKRADARNEQLSIIG